MENSLELEAQQVNDEMRSSTQDAIARMVWTDDDKATQKAKAHTTSKAKAKRAYAPQTDNQNQRIANWLAVNLPIYDDTHTTGMAELATEYKAKIDAMPKHQQRALKMAYIFAHKVPRQDSEDLFQELALALLECGKSPECNQYIVARRVWVDWWRARYYKVNNEVSLAYDVEGEVSEKLGINEVLLSELVESNTEMALLYEEVKSEIADKAESKALSEDFVSATEFSRDNPKAKALWDSLPERIKAIGKARVDKRPVATKDRVYLMRWLRENGDLAKAI